MKYDLHSHTKYSLDCTLDPEKIIKIARKKRLSGIAITDHNTIKGGLAARKYETEDLKVIVGSEISTERGDIIGIFLSEEIRSRTAVDVVSEIRDQNGIVIIPHPFDTLRRSALNPTDNDGKLMDCIEIFNSRCIFQESNGKAVDYARKNNVGITAGSDAHFLNEIGNAGVITETEDVREAILKNKIEIFGKKSYLINHGFTKAIKLWRKIKFV
jgi:predicted metal-dependent phosphoesterase TrpH